MSSNTNLGNTPVNQGFVQLIHTGETGGIDGTLRTLFDGDGTASDLQIASDKVKISTELFIGSKTLTEFVQDTVGAMFTTGNSLTNISITYDDANGNIDLSASGEVTITGTQTLSNKTLASPIIDSVTISTIQTSSESFADNDTSLMTSAAINDKIGTEVASLVDSAPGTLDTLNELAAALGDDPNFATTTATNIATKLAKASNLSDLASASTARSNLGVDAAGTDNSTNVTLANTNYLSISGQEITGGTIPVASGGTGATSASGARTALGIGAIGQLATISVSNFNDAALQTSSESFADNDTSIMTSAAIQDKIQSFGFTTNTGDMTGVSITANDPLDISQSNTTSGNYSATISLDATEFGSYLTDMTDLVVGDTDELAVLDNGTLKRKQIDEIRLTAFDSTGFSSGISFDGSTANGVLTFKDSDEATVESSLTFDGGALNLLTTTANRRIEIGLGATQDVTSFVDLIGDTTYSDYGGRFIRFGGANAETRIMHRGTGDLALLAQDSASISFRTGSTERLRISSAGDVDIKATKKLYFDGGSHTYISEQSDDNLLFKVGNQNMLIMVEGDTDYVRVPDSVRLSAGSSNDLQMVHDGTNSFLLNNNGNLTISNLDDDKDLILKSDDGSGGTTAYITLDGSITKTTFNQDARVVDNKKIAFGNADDLQLFHNGTNSFISNYGGALFIENNVSDSDMYFRVSDDGSIITALRIDASDNARVKLANDNQKLSIGESNDIEIFHDGTDSTMLNQTGDLIIKNNANDAGIRLQCDDGSGGTTNYITCDGQFTSINLLQSTALPATKKLFFDGGNGTYVHELSDNVIEFRTDNNPQLKIDNSAGVIVNDGSYASFDFRVESNNNTHMLFVDSGNDRVGIGVTSPGEKLHVKDASNNVNIKIETDKTDGMAQVQYLNDARQYNVGINNTDAWSVFDATASATRFHINSSGNIGIGTSSPSSYRLQFGNAGDKIGVDLSSGGTTRIAEIEFYNGSDGSMKYKTQNSSSGGHEFYTQGSQRMEVLRNGNIHINNSLGIGTSSPGALLHVQESGTGAGSGGIITETTTQNGNAGIRFRTDGTDRWAITTIGTNGEKLRIRDSDAGADRINITSTGAFHVSNDVVAFSSTPSDSKLKTNVKDIDYGLDTIMKLKPKQYDWKKDNRKDIGFIAQEVEEVIPEIVKDNEWFDDKIKTMDYEKLTAVLIKAVQEQQKQIDKLKNKLGE